MRDLLNVAVQRERAEDVRRLVKGEGLLDPMRKIKVRGGKVLIPVVSPPSFDLDPYLARLEQDDEPIDRHAKVDPFDKIVKILQLEPPLMQSIPRKWEKIGDILVLRLPPELEEHEVVIAEAYARVLGAKSVLQDERGISGEWRLPGVRKILGGDTETIHLEDGVRFKLDAAKVMFSSGNLPERMRMARIAGRDEVVVDMFAGIGYFTIPMAVHSRPHKIFACEVNPTAFQYLEENVRINLVESVEPLLGDCRETAPEGVADRVIMGYLRAQEFLPKAYKTLRPEGVLHYHEACPNELADSRPWSTVKKTAEDMGRTAQLLRKARLKSYAPGVSHIVLDVKLQTR